MDNLKYPGRYICIKSQITANHSLKTFPSSLALQLALFLLRMQTVAPVAKSHEGEPKGCISKGLQRLKDAIAGQEGEIAKYDQALVKLESGGCVPPRAFPKRLAHRDTPAGDLGATEEGKNMLLHMRSWFGLVLQRRREHLVQKLHYLTVSAMSGDDSGVDSGCVPSESPLT